VQILVVVENIQLGTLKTEAGKGSVSTAVGHGSLGTKANAMSRGKAHHSSWVCAAAERAAGSGIHAAHRNLAFHRQRLDHPTNRCARFSYEISFLLNALCNQHSPVVILGQCFGWLRLSGPLGRR
jgi:hypothetical protein